jgi:hypothetical protein
MKKKLLLYLLPVILLNLSGCKNESVVPESNPATSTDTRNARTDNVTGVIYVNDFYTILGDTAAENNLLSWSDNQGFTQLNLYNMSTILSDVNMKAELDAFISKAHGSMYHLKIGLVASGSGTASKIKDFCQSSASDPDAIVSEYEFWNKPNSYSTFSTLQTAINSVHDSYPAVKREVYVSKFTDASETNPENTDTICRRIIRNNETVCIVNYSNNAFNLSSTLKNKLIQLANNAQLLNKVVDVEIIFNVNTLSVDPNIYNYFSVSAGNHSFDEAYFSVLNDINNAAITNRSYLNIKGYSIYRYSNAILARP